MRSGGEREVSAGQAASRGSWRARGARLGSGFGQNARLAGRMAVGWRALTRGGSAWWWGSGGPDRSLNLLHPSSGSVLINRTHPPHVLVDPLQREAPSAAEPS